MQVILQQFILPLWLTTLTDDINTFRYNKGEQIVVQRNIFFKVGEDYLRGLIKVVSQFHGVQTARLYRNKDFVKVCITHEWPKLKPFKIVFDTELGYCKLTGKVALTA